MKKSLIIIGIILLVTLVTIGIFLLTFNLGDNLIVNLANLISNEVSKGNKANSDPEYANKMKAYMEEKYSKTFEIVYTDFSEGGFSRNGTKYSYT